MAGTTFSGNLNGGGAVFQGTANVTGTTFSNNTGSTGGGAYFNSTANVTATTFSGNTASSSGGGAYFTAGTAMQLVNVLFARNRASSNGAAVYVNNASPLSLIHTTIVSPTAPTGGTQAVYVANGTVYLTNTIIASHTTGIQRAGGAVVENYNLFSDVATPYNGVTGGSNSITGTAAFYNSSTYTLTASSAAIDAGTDMGITSDYFGATRSQGGSPDAGYAESPFANLPSVTVVGSSAAENNGPLLFTVTLSVVSSYPVTFTYQTQDGSATVADSDYMPIAPTQGVIPAGNLSTTISVNLTGDTKYELDETVGLSLSNVLSATVATGIATGTITNDDSAPSVTFCGNEVKPVEWEAR